VRWLIPLALVASMLGCAHHPQDPAVPDHRGVLLLRLDDFAGFTQGTGASPHELTLTSPEIPSAIAWDELVPSWNAGSNLALTVEVRALYPDKATKFYQLGRWSTDPDRAPRASLRGQKDADGDVQTDTLVLKRATRCLQLRLTVSHLDGAPVRAGSFQLPLHVSLCLLDSHAQPAPLFPHTAAWGKTIDVPVRSQADYPEGVSSWCSPTSTAMLLAHWARELGRPELDFAVPDVAQAVFDPQWPGTGNWPFNTAFAGAQPGLRSCVARFTDVAEIERWIAHGFPVAASVSYARLKGRPQPEAGDGHLVVVVGFTADGDVIVNDPGVRRERVRRTFPRQDFSAAWASSHRTVYLVWPEDAKLPPDEFGHW